MAPRSSGSSAWVSGSGVGSDTEVSMRNWSVRRHECAWTILTLSGFQSWIYLSDALFARTIRAKSAIHGLQNRSIVTVFAGSYSFDGRFASLCVPTVSQRQPLWKFYSLDSFAPTVAPFSWWSPSGFSFSSEAGLFLYPSWIISEKQHVKTGRK